MTKMERAAQLAAEARAQGCELSLKGDWVVFTPPPPTDILIRASKLGDELAALVRSA